MTGIVKKMITMKVAIVFLVVSCVLEVSYVYAHERSYYGDSSSYYEHNCQSEHYGKYLGDTSSERRNPRHYEGDWGAMARKYALEAILYCIAVVGGIWVKVDVSGKKLIECSIDPRLSKNYVSYGRT